MHGTQQDAERLRRQSGPEFSILGVPTAQILRETPLRASQRGHAEDFDKALRGYDIDETELIILGKTLGARKDTLRVEALREAQIVFVHEEAFGFSKPVFGPCEELDRHEAHAEGTVPTSEANLLLGEKARKLVVREAYLNLWELHIGSLRRALLLHQPAQVVAEGPEVRPVLGYAR